VKIADATFALIDTETNGTEEGCDLLEVAVHLYRPHGPYRLLLAHDVLSTLVKPTKPIPPEASGIHGLIDEDFEDAPDRFSALVAVQDFIPADAIIVAHKADFDLRMLEPSVIPSTHLSLCTWRMAHHLTPEAPNFKLGTLRYLYGFHHLDVGAAHRADADLLVLAPVFFHLVARYRAWAEEKCAGDLDRLAKAEEVETMVKWAKGTFRLARPAFGKHKTWDDLFADQGYLGWMLNLPDLSPEMRFSIAREREARSGG
jgi:exodeoxyribonuclease X